MKKYLAITWSLILIFLALNTASAQLIDTQDLNDITQTVAVTAHYGQTSVGHFVAVVLQAVLSFLSIIFLVLIIISGFRWMTAGGNDEQVKKATSTMTSAVIGLVVVLAAYAITYFIFKIMPFTGGTVGPQGGVGH